VARGAYIESSYRFSKRVRYSFGAASALLFLAGVIAVIWVFTGSNPAAVSSSAPATKATVIPKQSGHAAPRNVKLDPVARRVLGRFVLTAVARTNLAEAYQLSGPGLRQGMPLKEWLKGAIPVVPFPVFSLKYAPFKIDYSHPNHALVEVAMVPTGKHIKAGIKPQIFFADLVRLHGRWFVDSWAPRGFPALPRDANHG
jgi:hypothetical protein